MNEQQPDEVAPLFERWFPELSREEQVRATRELRHFLRIVYRIYIRLEEQGQLDPDSAESDSRDILESG